VGYGDRNFSVNVRRPWHNLRGSSGQPIRTEIRIVDPELVSPYPLDSAVSSAGTTDYAGVLSKPEMTAKAIDSEGWFNTGDLGWVTLELMTGGEPKDCSNNEWENIEPQPIEDACLRSSYIDKLCWTGSAIARTGPSLEQCCNGVPRTSTQTGAGERG